ncbi:MAG: hypothetical protein AAFW60_06145, partial [Pseudomonadota bacterium]
ELDTRCPPCLRPAWSSSTRRSPGWSRSTCRNSTVRLFAEIEPLDNVSVRLDVDNLFDETYYTDSFANVWVQPGAPQRFRLRAAYRF